MIEPSVSVVVATHQRRESILRLLGALRHQTLQPSQFEAIVAIDGATDGTREALESFRSAFCLLALSLEHRGRAATVNAGVGRATGEVVVILDDDMEPSPELLSAHLREHARGRRVGVVGAAPVRLGASTSPFARFTGTRFNDVLAEMTAQGGSLRFEQTYTGNFSIRRADFEAVGGFDETFDGYGLEDYELALRLIEDGVELVVSTEAVAHQNYEKDFPEAARDSESRGRSAFIFTTLHPAAAEAILRDPTAPSTARRLVRYLLPRATRLLPVLPGMVVRLARMAERRRLVRLPFVYELGLEYFFLLGWREAARDRRPTARGSRW